MLSIVQAIAPQGSDVTQQELDGALVKLIEMKIREGCLDLSEVAGNLANFARNLSSFDLGDQHLAELLALVDRTAEQLLLRRQALERRIDARANAKAGRVEYPVAGEQLQRAG